MSNQQWQGFAWGFLSGLAVNGLLALALVGISWLIFWSVFEMSRATTDRVALVAFCGLPLVLNGAAIVVLGVKRRWMALGAFVALGLVGLALVMMGAWAFWFLFARGN